MHALHASEPRAAAAAEQYLAGLAAARSATASVFAFARLSSERDIV
jgi:hypothetical protein